MSHVLVVVREDEDNFDFTLECSGECGCFQECLEAHPVGHLMDECPTPDDSCRCEPDCGDEEEFHGVLHTYESGYGWTIPVEGCGVQPTFMECDTPYEIARRYGPGRWEVDVDFDEGHACLIFAGPSEG